ncbi:DNA-processing protein DprA [Christiangramia forsetii]|uniref:Smf family protein n=2 Tax=Christiangramia forsetii TaxID=411153 RepID=A0M6F0_CHRFK|nr:DNA-processing protein DprA [Christiangramia forsetii]GGG30575.1 DNA processing protein DprA [Christiangramia forsetii]CAL68195.1 Smf family protein [Christiangramia forsetii KT0803]
MNSEDLIYTLALQHIPNLGDTTAKKLIRKLGSAENIFKEKKINLLKIDGIGQIRIKELHDTKHLKAAENELKFIEKNSIQTFYFQDEDYPEKLKHCLDGPILLFSRGNIELHKRRIISIVGTRQITPHGVSFCEKLIEDLAILNPVIISGFAYGVDITAQKAAVKNGLQTIGCLAHGLNQIYPKSHKKYMSEIEDNGGFFTDFWSTDTFDRNNFLKRNRIIAGLSEATIVIESAEKGGALVTADIANSYDREVFAVPGRPSDKFSLGCNNLIKAQQAHVLTSVADLAYILNWKVAEEIKPVQKQLFIELEEDEQRLYEFLKLQGKTELDMVALNCNFPTFKTASLLLNMELKGAIRPLPGKLFEVI